MRQSVHIIVQCPNQMPSGMIKADDRWLVVPYRTTGGHAVAFMEVLQDSNVLHPRSERVCQRTTAIQEIQEIV
ncbi:hypothetical protein R6Q57_014461 [Mikania cordata]